MIFPCLYNAPLVYYALMLQEDKSFIVEQHDHYTKQTYRNRCRIMGGNGVMDMHIPVVKNHGKKTLLKDVRIDQNEAWQAVHWKSINSAYSSSPFFEYIEDYYQIIYSKKHEFLTDLNCELLTITLELLNIDLKYTLTESFLDLSKVEDIRDSIHPKRPFISSLYSFDPLPYQQVFSDRHGFAENLSILDLLFNEGQNSGVILRKSLTLKAQ